MAVVVELLCTCTVRLPAVLFDPVVETVGALVAVIELPTAEPFAGAFAIVTGPAAS